MKERNLEILKELRDTRDCSIHWNSEYNIALDEAIRELERKQELPNKIKQILDKYEHMEANEDSAVNLFMEVKELLKTDKQKGLKKMSNKVVDGVELLRMIRDGEIKNGTEMVVQIYKRNLIYKGMDDLIDKATSKSVEVKWLIDATIEILSEEDEEIDIQSIGELPVVDDTKTYDEISIGANRVKINKLIKAVKQLDKKIKEKE